MSRVQHVAALDAAEAITNPYDRIIAIAAMGRKLCLLPVGKGMGVQLKRVQQPHQQEADRLLMGGAHLTPAQRQFLWELRDQRRISQVEAAKMAKIAKGGRVRK